MKKLSLLCILIICFTGNDFLNAQGTNQFRSRQCLNGWWDFLPVLTPDGKKYTEPGKIPADGWLKNSMIVPGSWKKTPSELKKGSEIWDQWRISDSFGFPSQWDSANSAWYRRDFQLKEIRKDRDYFLRFDGILRESWIFVNGMIVGHRKEGTLPSEYDISGTLKIGNNEIVVFVTDYRRDENGRTFVNVGADQMGAQMGIWGDVFLEERPLVRVENLTVRTSTRKNELTIIYSLLNTGKAYITLDPEFTVTTKDKTYLSFRGETVTLKPGETREFNKIQSWSGYIPWSPENPQLYYLNIGIKGDENYLDSFTERFGFREVWIEGHNIILNGTPVHLLGEWGHKDHFDFFRPEYVRQWFGMLKDLNMNYIRTHTFPHPQFMIDLADETGILVCLESSWFMSGAQAMDKEEYWTNTKDNARSIINLYKNHPSVILWSAGNEVRWGWDVNAVIKNGPEIQKIYEETDPTRIAFFDGSTSLWDERSQKIISRHYGLECTGEDFPDKSKPLHVGEFGKWHYGQPIDNLVWGNDEIFGSFEKCATAIAEEAADIIQQGRSNEVACLFPWNLSCLDNFRPSSVEVLHKWADISGPFAKPFRTGPYVSEFAWWQPESKGYIPGAGFSIIKHANRPFAIYIREKLNQVFDNQEIPHTVSLINDLGHDVDGILKVETFLSGKIIYSKSYHEMIKNGGTLKEEIIIPPCNIRQRSGIVLKTSFCSGKTLIDSVSRKIFVTSAVEKENKWKVDECMVFGPGLMRNILNMHSVRFRYISTLDSVNFLHVGILIIEKNAILAGSTQNKRLESFINNGGKIFLMEQDNSALPGLSIESKPSEQCFIRTYNHPLMNRFKDDEFRYWGNAPYGKSNSESWVVIRPYLKPVSGNTTILLDAGFGDFGSGGLLWSPLFETRSGKGIAVISQLRLTEKMDFHPSAVKMIHEILSYLSSWSPISGANLAVDHSDREMIETLGIDPVDEEKANVILAPGKIILEAGKSDMLLKKVSEGATLVLHNLDSSMITSLAMGWNIDVHPVNLGPQYNLIRENSNEILNGISNQETYWLDKAHYTAVTNENHKMCDWLFASRQGISLLSSESESCWREFYTEGAMSEWLRMPVITHYLYNGPRDHASGMMVFTVGKGKLILTQIPLPENGYSKSKTYWSQLMANLHVQFSKNLFEGEKVVFGTQKSNGFAESIRIIKNPGKELVDQIISKGDPEETSERFQNQGLSDGFKWEKISTVGGELKTTPGCKELMGFYELYTGRPRKLQEVVGGWPDPGQQTMLDITGKGEVTLIVNGRKYPSIHLDGPKANIPDINLNQFWNSVLIYFVPEDGSGLKMLWRDRQNRPELEFQFD